jgi:hypothetical protein
MIPDGLDGLDGISGRDDLDYKEEERSIGDNRQDVMASKSVVLMMMKFLQPSKALLMILMV